MKRHPLSTRLWHWLNLPCLVILFMSGLTISNAHPYLYWGDWGFAPDQAWLAVPGFPGWMTIPSEYSLSAARDWHILMAWPFALGLLFIWIAMIVNRHFRRHLRTRRREWTRAAIAADVKAHLRLDFDHGGQGGHGGHGYNFLQRLAYGVVLGVFLPMMVVSGMAISPGIEPAIPWLVDALGGRQSARSLHFLFAWGLFGFLIIHVVLVLLNRPLALLRDMITGGER